MIFLGDDIPNKDHSYPILYAGKGDLYYKLLYQPVPANLGWDPCGCGFVFHCHRRVRLRSLVYDPSSTSDAGTPHIQDKYGDQTQTNNIYQDILNNNIYKNEVFVNNSFAISTVNTHTNTKTNTNTNADAGDTDNTNNGANVGCFISNNNQQNISYDIKAVPRYDFVYGNNNIVLIPKNEKDLIVTTKWCWLRHRNPMLKLIQVQALRLKIVKKKWAGMLAFSF